MSVHQRAQAARASAPAAPEVYSAEEVGRAAGVDRRVIRRLIAGGEIATIDGALVAQREVVRLVRRLRRGPVHPQRPVFGGALLDRGLEDSSSAAASAAISTLAHGTLIPLVIMLTAVQTTTAADRPPDARLSLSRLVFVADPGPGGGGGGGGLRQPPPPSRAERRGERRVSSPVPPREEPAVVEPAETPRAREPLESEALPPIAAPLMAMRADGRDLRGLLEAPPATSGTPSQGPGRDGGVGAGTGRGVGAGAGAGVGPGSGGGVGGGPYRAGSGISPPAIRREVKPVYTANALRREIEGDVILEVVVLASGAVGEIRVVRGLGHGLDEAAVTAMRRWRFHPARRRGAAVDVVVEVAMEFRLR